MKCIQLDTAVELSNLWMGFQETLYHISHNLLTSQERNIMFEKLFIKKRSSLNKA
jgi:hypothetical protein